MEVLLTEPQVYHFGRFYWPVITSCFNGNDTCVALTINASSSDAEAMVRSVLGLDSYLNLGTYDPFKDSVFGGPP